MNTNSQIAADGSGQSWERFAQADPYLYILTSMNRNDPSAFWRSGEEIVNAELVPFLQVHGVRRLVGLEVGGGVGRLALPLAQHFQTVVGVDISRGMVERATTIASERGIPNASFAAISGPEDFLRQTRNYTGACDFIYSLLVFQHIPDFSLIEGYLHVIRNLLHKQGFAYLQFDTRRKTFAYQLKTCLPDFLLPRFWRRGIRRIRRSAKEIEAAMQSAGLEIIAELTPRTAYHRYILRRPQSPTGSR